MKVHGFSVLSVAGAVLLAVCVFSQGVFGNELQWKKSGSSDSVLRIPTVITTDDLPHPTGPVISQVQYTEPIQPPRMIQTPIDPDYPTPGPGSKHYVIPNNPPSGATLAPIPLPQGNVPRQVREKPQTTCGDKVTLRSIRDISHDIRPTQTGELPEECVIDSAPFYGRHFSQSCVMWKASAVSTKAAYFEDVQLERYGNTIVCPALQPVVSGAKFFATIPFLPYKMGVTPPEECVYTLGHHRPGNRVPYMVEPLPISARGALFQAGAVLGGVAALP
jgi:hypothetical protein